MIIDKIIVNIKTNAISQSIFPIGNAARGFPTGRDEQFGGIRVNEMYTQNNQRQIFEAAFPYSDYITDTTFLRKTILFLQFFNQSNEIPNN